MILIVVIGIVLIATAGAQMLVVHRRNDDPLDRHERAIAALRDVAEHPHPLVADPHPELPPTANIRILSEPPADAVARRRRARRAAAARRRAEAQTHPRNIADRPTAARLPTQPVPTIHINGDDLERPARTVPAPLPALPSVELEPTHLRDSRGPRHSHVHLSRRVKTGAIVTTAFAAALAAIVAIAPSGGTPKHAASSAPPPPARTPTTRPAPVTTATTAPSVMQVAAAPGGVSGTVVVAVPFTLTMATNAPCWVMVQTSAGQTLFQGTLLAGQQKQVSGAGPLTIRMGNTAAMQMTLNGTPLDLAGMAKTANVQFNPA
jgi:uncharacterized protein DUF4115